jgi:16S rRNA (cytosine967-C5)-methyltransferase
MVPLLRPSKPSTGGSLRHWPLAVPLVEAGRAAYDNPMPRPPSSSGRPPAKGRRPSSAGSASASRPAKSSGKPSAKSSGKPSAKSSGRPAAKPSGGKPDFAKRGRGAAEAGVRSEGASAGKAGRPAHKSAKVKSWGETRNAEREAERRGPRVEMPAEERRPREERAFEGRPRRDDRPRGDRPFGHRPGKDGAFKDERRDGRRPERGARSEERPEARAERKSDKIRVGSSRKVLEGAVDLLDAMFPSRDTGDRVRQAWMKQHHKLYDPAEREALLHTVDEVLRLRGRLDWWIAGGKNGLPPDARLRVAAYRILSSNAKADGLLWLFGGGDAAVEGVLRRLEGHTLEHPDMPSAAKHSGPDWIMPQLQKRFGADLDLELAAMLRAAPLDVRVNRLKTTRDAASSALQAEGLRSQPTPFSPIGLRLSPQAYVNNTQAHAEGLIEPQDEGSQIAAQLVDAGGCKFVVDFCAGAGGKTLVLGAAMKNAGRLVAMDVSTIRLTQAKQRLRRAGVHNAETRELDGKWIKRHAEKAERVLVDAPCTGTGTWRRKPDAKWRLSQQDLDELVPRQAEILERAAKLVSPKGGRLVYVTCSVLMEENEEQVAAFLKRHPDFSVLPVTDIWAKTVGGACPVPGPYLSLSPGRHGTDGFFAAILVRSAR